MQLNLDNDFFEKVFLFAATSFVACFLWSLKSLKNSYKEDSFLRILGNIFFKSCSAMAMSVGIILVLPDKILDYTITPDMLVGIAIFASIYGQGIVDVYLKKKFNLTTADLHDKYDAETVENKIVEYKKSEQDKVGSEGNKPEAKS